MTAADAQRLRRPARGVPAAEEPPGPPGALLEAYHGSGVAFRTELRRTLDAFHRCDEPLARGRILQLLGRPHWVVGYVVGQGSEPFRDALLHGVERVGGSVTFHRKGTEPPAFRGAIRLSLHSRGEGSGLWHYKRAYLPFMFHLDRQGYSGWSELRHEPADRIAAMDAAEAKAFFADVARRVIAARLTNSRQGPTLGVPEPGYVFVALQVPNDSVLRLAFGRDYLALVAAAIRSLLDAGERVVVKPHPKGRFPAVLDMLAGLSCDRLAVNDGGIHDLIPPAKAVLTANSGVGFEALLYEKPVLCLAEADYAHAAWEVREAGRTAEVLAAALAGHDPSRIHRLVHAAMTRFQVDARSAEAVDRHLLRLLCIHAQEAGVAMSEGLADED